ncbi:MAG: hypothetical protein OEY89_16480 [Gammaproteobacteria bacterium]|nr:hypothetical protein [Gammaproteobacteria bacterium]
MSTGKYISLEEARNDNKLDRFIKEHPNEVKKKDFEILLDAMCKDEPPKKKAQQKVNK